MHDRHYDSVAELMAVEVSRANAGHCAATDIAHDRSSGVAINKWLGVSSHREVERLARQGWPEGLKRIQAALHALAPKGVGSIRRRRVRRDHGDTIDMQRVYAGDLEHAWSATERHTQRDLGRLVTTLLVDVGANWTRTADELLWRGAVAVTLADALERSGRRVEIVAFTYTRGLHLHQPGSTLVSAVVKHADEPLDAEHLATVVALAGFYRTYFFKAEMSADTPCTGNLGMPIHIKQGPIDPAAMPEAIAERWGDRPAIVVDGIWSQGAAQEFVTAMCETVGNGAAAVAQV